MTLLMVDGAGDPNTLAYREAVAALDSVAYALKFAVKKTPAIDDHVFSLEGFVVDEGHGGLLGRAEIRLVLDDDDLPTRRGHS